MSGTGMLQSVPPEARSAEDGPLTRAGNSLTTSSPVASPCTSVCRMDAATGWCEGCLRTIDEIIAWGRQDDAGKHQVLLRLPPRRLARAQQQAAASGVDQPPGESP